MNEALEAISNILAWVYAQTWSAVQRGLENALRRSSTQLQSEARRAMVNVQRTLERDNYVANRDVAQC